MTAKAAILRRVGIVGHFNDPAAQLLQDQPRMAQARFFEIVSPDADAATMDLVFVLSVDDALAHLAALRRCAMPCEVLLSRTVGAKDAGAWQSSIHWLARALDRIEMPDLSLVAFTPEAADTVSAELGGRPVGVLQPLPRLPGQRPPLSIRRNEPVSVFTIDAPDGTRDTRRVEIEGFNWARLRRLAQLRAGDTTDRAMGDLIDFANGTGAPLPCDTKPLCLLAVVPNGVGLGHVTRMMAIARILKDDCGARVIFWSFSRAAELMQAAGFEVILRHNAVHLNAHAPSWRMWETLELARAIQVFRADLVSNDGANFDPFIFAALRVPGCGHCGVLWVRRGMLRPDTDAKFLEIEQNCDLVFEPGDLAVENDKGPTRTRQATHRGFSRRWMSRPVTLKPFMPDYSEQEAKRRLNLGSGRHVLVTLGGAFGDWDALKRRLEDEAARRRIRLVWAQSPLAAPPEGDGGATLVRQFYPLSRYLSAFDGVVTAAGYNSFHELMMAYDRPVLFAPTNFVRLDDQVARAQWAHESGLSDIVLADKPHEHAAKIGVFMEQVEKGRKTQRPPRPFGGKEIAAAILAASTPYRAPEDMS